jgi:hypothetical protein
VAKTDEANTSEQTDTADEESKVDEKSTENDEAVDEDEPVSEPVDQSPALRNDGALNLGICHFGGASEPASRLATRSDGTGWIAVCEEHTKEAEDAGFVLEKQASS